MKATVIWSAQSVQNLREIYAYIAEDSPMQAQRVTREIIDCASLLQDFPEMGIMLSELSHMGLRQLTKFSYRIIYTVSAAEVNIVAIIHGRQDFIPALYRNFP